MSHNKTDLITASEIARYVYCQRAWAYDYRQVQRRRIPFWGWLVILISMFFGILVVLISIL